MSLLLVLLVLNVVLIQTPVIKGEYDAQRFRQIVTNDRTNDDAKDLTTEQLILRSGFRYRLYYAVSDDGYISQVFRICNPLADQTKLKQPPVLLVHGAYFDTSSWLMASSIQHHPEPWPRPEGLGPITSSNRSLGFMLANNGYDVWLFGARGSNRGCQAYTKDPQGLQANLSSSAGADFEPDESMYQFVRTNGYWQYGIDDIVKYELKKQVDIVRQVTGAEEFMMFSFSLGTPTTMGFLSVYPDYAKMMRIYVQMAPTIAPSHFTLFPKVYAEYLIPILPTRGDGFTPTYFLDQTLKAFVVSTSQASMTLRYSLISQLLRGLYGPSPNFQTNLELNFLGHLFKMVSFKSVKQYGQNSQSRKFTKFDYGPRRNQQEYGQSEPPVYNITRLEVQNYAIISGEVDALASPDTVNRLIRTVQSPRLLRHIEVPEYNHIDLLAGVENDKQVTLPALQLFEQVRDRN